MGLAKKRLLKELFENDLATAEPCTAEENSKYAEMDKENNLPDDIELIEKSKKAPRYAKYIKSDFTNEEMKLYLIAKLNGQIRWVQALLVILIILIIVGMIFLKMR